MKQLAALIIILAFSFGCKQSTTTQTAVEVPVLRASHIFDGDSVSTFLTTYGDQNKKLADSYFSKGEGLIDENITKAIWNMKRAITLYPDLKYYTKLKDVLVENRLYDDAYKLLALLVNKHYHRNDQGQSAWSFVFDKPDFDTYYDFVIVGILRGGYYFDAYTIDQAVELGFDKQEFKSRLVKDKRFPYVKGTKPYDECMLAFLSEGEIETYCNDPLHFETFLSRIPQVETSFAIDKNSITNFYYDDFNGRKGENGGALTYIESNFLKQKKDNPNEWITYNVKAKLKLNETIWMLIYAIDTSALACPKEMRHLAYSLATYTSTGDLIDCKQVAWQSAEQLATANISTNEVTISEYKRTWKKPYDKYDFENEIVVIENTREKKMKIGPDGKITELNPTEVL